MYKRTAAILASAAVIALLVTPPAQAAGPDKLAEYGAGSSATALVVSLLGEELAVSATTAAVGSTPQAAADGAAFLVAGSPVPGGAPAAAPSGEAENASCPVQADLDEITSGALSALELNIACVNTSASVADGAPTAASEGDEVRIVITGLGGDVLAPVLGPLFENVDTISSEVITALDPIFQVVEETTQIELDDVLTDIIADLDDTEIVLAEIVDAASVSRAHANDTDGVVAEAGSNAVTINLFPGLASQLAEIAGLDVNPNSDPLLTVKLGSAKASVVRDPVTGAPAPDASAAQLASITADDELGIIQEITGQVTGAIDDLAVDELSCEGGALADIICIDLGSVHELTPEELKESYPDFGAGTVGRRASAASVAVLPVVAEALGTGTEVLGLSLASAEAAAYAIPAAPAPAPPVENDEPLPRTGGDVNVVLALGLFAAAAAGLAAIRRTRSV